jgi:glycosyltransferase involved in cell wall biosynthesis
VSTASVILPTYNKAEYLALTLASYEHQTTRDYEIVIIDDGSTDSTREVVDRYAKQLPIKYQRQENRGRSAARNRALALAEGEVVIFSDDDRLVAPDFIAAHLRRFAPGQPGAIVLGWQKAILTFWRRDLHTPPHTLWRHIAHKSLGELIKREGPLATELDIQRRFNETVERLAFEEWWWTFMLPVIDRFGEELVGFELPWILGTTANLSAPREPLLAVGGFDEAYRGWGIEDHDLCYRLHRAGLRTVFARDAVSWHQAHPHSAGKWHDWVTNLRYLLNRYDTLDVALYVHACINQKAANYLAMNDHWCQLSRETIPPALAQGLREAWRRVSERRVETVLWSGAIRFLGRSYDDWL